MNRNRARIGVLPYVHNRPRNRVVDRRTFLRGKLASTYSCDTGVERSIVSARCCNEGSRDG